MRTDARSIFVISLLLFILVTGWRVWMAMQPRPAAAPSTVTVEPAKPTPFRPLGVMNLISNQFSAQALVVPVNPFRPTFEAMVRNPESGDLQAIAGVPAAGVPAAGTQRQADGQRDHGPRADPADRSQQRGGGRDRGGNPDPADPGPAPIPQFAFKGMFQRPDGRIAAYVGSTVGGGQFVAAGDTLAGFEVVEALAKGVTLKLADGTMRVLAKGDDPVALGVE